MYQTSDIRKGLKIEFDGEPYVCVEFQFVKPGKGNAFTRTKFKNMITGRVLEKTLKTGEVLKPANMEECDMVYLYTDGTVYHFMDTNTSDQVEISGELLGDSTNWLIEQLPVKVLFFNSRPVNIDLPNFVDLLITMCEPGVKGDTATGASKPATLSTGAIVNVPLFINDGETIRIDTRTGEYVGRAKT